MKNHFGIADGVLRPDGEGFDKIFGDLGILEALDFAAVFADEVRVLVRGGLMGVAEGVAPDTVFAADAVDHAFGVEGVEGAIDGDGIGMRGQFFENFDRPQWPRRAAENIQYARPHGGSPQRGLFQELFDEIIIHGE